MPTPPLSDAKKQAAVDAVARFGSVAAAARALDVPRNTLQWQHTQAVKDGFRARVRVKAGSDRDVPQEEIDRAARRRAYQGLGAEAIPSETDPPVPPPPPMDPLDIRREQALINQLRNRLKLTETELIAQQDWRRQVESMSGVATESPLWLPKPHVAKGHRLIPMLFSSDFQCGEVIRAADLDGINEYNQDIFVERYQAMIDKTIELATHNTGATEFPYAIYLRGGDAISGEIHEELAQTNDLSSIPALRLLKQQEAEGIRRLKARFGKVRVISIVGNHGRTTHKSHAKGYSERSFETALAWWLADAFEGDPNVTFWAPPSGDALFDVAGWSFLLSHGDRTGSKGGQGFVGPAATISRGHQKLYNNWTMTGRDVHCVLTGHLHTSLKLERGYANGSLAGYSEYARDFRAMPDAAKQWLFFVHQEVMISHAFELILSKKPRRSMLEQGSIAA